MIRKTLRKLRIFRDFNATHKGLMLAAMLCVAALAANGDAHAARGGRVWVAKPDDSKSCEPESGQSLKDAAQSLKSAGVRIHASRKASDGKAHIQMCGAPTGRLNAFQISKRQLKDAEAVGFKTQRGTPPSE